MAGRKRKPKVARTPSGQISRAQETYQEHVGPIMTRMRLWGLSEKDARDQKAESVIGRMCLRGQEDDGLSQKQWEALEEFKRQSEARSRALEARDSLRTASPRSMTPDEEQHAQWCRIVIAKYEGSLAAIMREQCEPSNRGLTLIGAVDVMALRNTEAPHLRPALRIAANALARWYKLDGR